jgi:hypothetical protein
MPGADAPVAARGVVDSTRVSHHGHTGITRHSPRNGFNSLFRALPGDRAFLPPSPAKNVFRQLDASVGASGPHDFAVREAASPVKRAARVHRIPPYVRDVAQRPSEWGGTATDIEVIWVRGQEKFGKSEIDSSVTFGRWKSDRTTGRQSVGRTRGLLINEGGAFFQLPMLRDYRDVSRHTEEKRGSRAFRW